MLALCGDLTDQGVPEEARELGRELPRWACPRRGARQPRSTRPARWRRSRLLCDAGSGSSTGETRSGPGGGLAGVKGFAGGFGGGPWDPGARRPSSFRARGGGRSPELERRWAAPPERRSPCCTTRRSGDGRGGAPGDLPFLGSSRLEEPLSAIRWTWCSTDTPTMGRRRARRRGVPVYNVAVAAAADVSGRAAVPDRRAQAAAGTGSRAQGRSGRRSAGRSAPGKAHDGSARPVILSEAKEP